MYKLIVPKVKSEDKLAGALFDSWRSNDVEIFTDLLKRVPDQAFIYYFSKMVSLDASKNTNLLIENVTANKNLHTNPLDDHHKMFAKVMQRASKELKQKFVLAYAVKTKNKALFEQALPMITSQKALGGTFHAAVEDYKHEYINLLLPKVTDQEQLKLSIFMSLSPGREEVFEKILARITDNTALTEIYKMAQLKKNLGRGEGTRNMSK